MLQSCAEISLLLGRYEGLMSPVPQPRLRRTHRIKTIQGSLAIEGNTLSLEQVTAVFDQKRVLGPKKEILEVQNAIETYQKMGQFKPHSIASFQAAHRLLMKGLIPDAGKWRKGQVGILKGSKVSHIAPPAPRVPDLMEQLFSTLNKSKNLHPLLRAAWVHYEVEFIHPFSDGNGRMGRLWQTVHLVSHHPLFEFLSVESIIRDRQREYYYALERSDKDGHAGTFVEFSLATMASALSEFINELRPGRVTASSRVDKAREHFGQLEFSRLDYLRFFKTLSTATASRDLKEGVESKRLRRSGERALTRYRFSGRG